MTILQTIETELGRLSTPVTFHLADLSEANATIFDGLVSADFPLCLVLPFDINDVSRENNKVISEAEINAIFLQKLEHTTLDNKAYDIESNVNSVMRALAREFINRLDKNDIIEDDGIQSVVHRTIQAEPLGDAMLYGSWAVFTVKFSEDLSTCLP